MTSKTKPDSRAHCQHTHTISFLTQDETKRLFSAIKTKRDRAIFLTAYRHGLRLPSLRRALALSPSVSKRDTALP